MTACLERLAPREHDYRHNDFRVRTVNMTEDESPNGHAHCRHLFLGVSETLPIVGGRLALLGAFDPAAPDSEVLCPDPTAVSVAGAKAGAAKRRGVGDLITNRRVRSIELGSEVAAEDLKPSELSLPGSGTDLLSGSGIYDAMWKVRLTRIYP